MNDIILWGAAAEREVAAGLCRRAPRPPPGAPPGPLAELPPAPGPPASAGAPPVSAHALIVGAVHGKADQPLDRRSWLERYGRRAGAPQYLVIGGVDGRDKVTGDPQLELAFPQGRLGRLRLGGRELEVLEDGVAGVDGAFGGQLQGQVFGGLRRATTFCTGALGSRVIREISAAGRLRVFWHRR